MSKTEQPLYLVLLPSEIKRLGGIEKVKEMNPGVVIKVRRMMQPCETVSTA